MLKKAGRLAIPLLLLGGCDPAPDNSALAHAEARQGEKAALDGRIDCALEGAKLFARTCTIEEMSGAQANILVVGRADTGYRRLAIAKDGRGVVSADGAEPARVTIVKEGLIEVAVGRDRYRLPANTTGAR
ncbi:hypothetical protein [Sphingopyxis sp. 113P3]|uniref:hypothetical protein n=1 Tax=Sphingopyxis sp. (strain 113P3) TaxID=292913 RepID=UPI0006AD1735|nr:hypothetical protein [Sphingopyxis sp. 113P3]